MVTEQRTTVLYEAPHRLVKLLEELQELCGDQRALQVTRELTKRHEQQVGPTVIAALTHFKDHPPQGEFTLVLGGAPQQEQVAMTDAQCRQQLAALIEQGMKPGDAAKDLSKTAGRSRRELYALLHEEQKQAD